MASKRRADTELNHDNWDDDYVSEEAGTFKRATQNSLQGRVIRKAKRRIEKKETSSNNVFSGFGSLVSNKMPEADFGFLKQFQTPTPGDTKASPKMTFGSSVGDSKASPKMTFGSSVGYSKASPKMTFGSSNKEPPGETNEQSSEYLSSLKSLNRSFLEWIKEHIEKDPCCILTPPFEDYKKHLNAIKEESETKENKTEIPAKTTLGFTDPKPSASQSFASTSSPSFTKFTKADEDKKSFLSSKPESEKKDKPFSFLASKPESEKKDQPFSFLASKPESEKKGQPFSFLASKPESEKKDQPFSFLASKPESEKKDAPFSFLSSKPDSEKDSKPGFSFLSSTTNGMSTSSGFSFLSNVKKPEASATTAEEESDEPPKVEFTAVVEESAVYSIRCKLFFKKDGNFNDKGVGMLYLKQTDSKKTQLIIRADTNLGNILLNILLQPDLPIQRMGKNNVMIMCVPNPPIDHKNPDKEPVPFLIRVKTAEDADQLKDKLEELKA